MQPFEDLPKKFAIISTILPLINSTTNAVTNIQTATQIGNDFKKKTFYLN